MRALLASKSAEVAQLCARHRVIRLSVFGSAARGSFQAGRSDVDLLVEFDPMPPAEHASHYFGLQEDLGPLEHTGGPDRVEAHSKSFLPAGRRDRKGPAL